VNGPRLIARLALLVAGLVTISLGTAAPPAQAAEQTPGIDVSNHQPTIDWSAVRASGVRWTYVLATEGTSFRNPIFASQYVGSYRAGLIRGAYHMAHPLNSSGAAQARYFLANGGRWSADGRTLPGALDLEQRCGDLAGTRMRAWIVEFQSTYRAATGRYAVIYTSPSWWRQCVGTWSAGSAAYPLWIANYRVSRPTIPAGWSYYTMWQWTDRGRTDGIPRPVDRNRFNGSLSRLQAFALG